MMTVLTTSPALDFPPISEFLKLAQSISPDCVLSSTDIQSRPFMKHWRHLIIFQHVPKEEDFRVSFFGTKVVRNYGEDWTGKLLSECGFILGFDKIYRTNRQVMKTRKMLAESGSLDWQDRHHKKWHQVKLPFRRNDEITDVLTIICFE